MFGFSKARRAAEAQDREIDEVAARLVEKGEALWPAIVKAREIVRARKIGKMIIPFQVG